MRRMTLMARLAAATRDTICHGLPALTIPMLVLPALVLPAVLIGCGTEDQAARVPVVRNALVAGWTSSGEWTLEEDLRLFGPEGGQFGVIGALAADSKGNIYVLDGLAQEIHVFDPGGSFARTLGGEGEGPGELRMATGLAFDPGDTLWVVDPLAKRYSVFAPDGRFSRVRTRLINGASDAEPCVFTSEGGYVDWATRFPNEERTGNLADIDLVHMHPVLLAFDGEAQDTFPPLVHVQEMAEMPSLGGMLRPVLFGGRIAQALDCRRGHLVCAHARVSFVQSEPSEGTPPSSPH